MTKLNPACFPTVLTVNNSKTIDLTWLSEIPENNSYVNQLQKPGGPKSICHSSLEGNPIWWRRVTIKIKSVSIFLSTNMSHFAFLFQNWNLTEHEPEERNHNQPGFTPISPLCCLHTQHFRHGELGVNRFWLIFDIINANKTFCTCEKWIFKTLKVAPKLFLRRFIINH